jgi:pyridoxal biosynthesis lyase PdxS
MKQLSKIGFMTCIVTSAFAFGCAATPLHTDTSTAGIRAAEEVGAADVPQASLHLQLAKEELEKAKALSKDGEQNQAKSMLERAESDAELAVALSREDAEKTDAQAALERAVLLQREANGQ